MLATRVLRKQTIWPQLFPLQHLCRCSENRGISGSITGKRWIFLVQFLPAKNKYNKLQRQLWRAGEIFCWELQLFRTWTLENLVDWFLRHKKINTGLILRNLQFTDCLSFGKNVVLTSKPQLLVWCALSREHPLGKLFRTRETDSEWRVFPFPELWQILF